MKIKIILLMLPVLIASGAFAAERIWISGNYKYELTDNGLKVTQISEPAKTNRQAPNNKTVNANQPSQPEPSQENSLTLPQESENPPTPEAIDSLQETTTPSDQPALSSQPEQATEQDTQTATDDSEPKESLMETIVDFVQEATASIFNGFAGLFKIFKF